MTPQVHSRIPRYDLQSREEFIIQQQQNARSTDLIVAVGDETHSIVDELVLHKKHSTVIAVAFGLSRTSDCG